MVVLEIAVAVLVGIGSLRFCMDAAMLVRTVWSCRVSRLWVRQIATSLHGVRLRKPRLELASAEIDTFAGYAEFTAREVKR